MSIASHNIWDNKICDVASECERSIRSLESIAIHDASNLIMHDVYFRTCFIAESVNLMVERETKVEGIIAYGWRIQ